MPSSIALKEFDISLGMAEALLQIEKASYHNPPRSGEQIAVRGLRGGAAVLVVAAFEMYLRQCMEERLSALTSLHLKLSLQKLPDKMRVNHIYNSLERAMKGPAHQPSLPRVQRLLDIDKVCRIIIAGSLDPTAFSDTGNNPNSKNVKEMFSRISLDDIYFRIKCKFDKRWGIPTAQTFIEGKLDEIVSRRHVVAHTADALKISRADLKESVRFLRILARLLDAEIEGYVKSLIKICT